MTYGDVSLTTLPASGAGSVLASCHSLLATWEPTPDAQGTPVTKYKVEWYTAPPIYEVQTVAHTGATGGAFTLSYNGETTDYLVFDLSQNGMKEALEGLPSIQQVDVKRTVSVGVLVCSFIRVFACLLAAGVQVCMHLICGGGLWFWSPAYHLCLFPTRSW